MRNRPPASTILTIAIKASNHDPLADKLLKVVATGEKKDAA